MPLSLKMPSMIAGAALAGAILMAGAPSAQAMIIFDPGNHPQPGETNILFGASETGSPIIGEVDHSGIAVQFGSLTGETLNQNAQGQASITNAAGGKSQLTSIGVTLPGGQTFGDFILNLQGLDGSASIDVVDNLGNISLFT